MTRVELFRYNVTNSDYALRIFPESSRRRVCQSSSVGFLAAEFPLPARAPCVCGSTVQDHSPFRSLLDLSASLWMTTQRIYLNLTRVRFPRRTNYGIGSPEKLSRPRRILLLVT